MKKPPLRFLETVASALALLGLFLVIALVMVYQQMPAEESAQNTAIAAAQLGASTNYDEQKALAAGLQQDLTGKQLFNNNCKQCHAVDQIVVGPALGNVSKRRTKEWIHGFVKNSSKMIQDGDPVAKELFEKFNRTQMPAFNFKAEEIDAILNYIAFESAAYGM